MALSRVQFYQNPCIVGNVEKQPSMQFLRKLDKIPSLYLDAHQKFLGSILDWNQSSIQGLEQSVQQFLCDQVDDPPMGHILLGLTRKSALYKDCSFKFQVGSQ